MKGVSVKAKAKFRSLLDNKLKDDLIKEDRLDDKIAILKNIYPFLNLGDSKISIEEKLSNNYKRQLKSLEYFLSGLDKEFFEMYFSKNNLYLIQDIITSIVNGSLADNYEYFVNNPYLKNININKDSTLRDFIEGVKDSHLRRVLLPFLNENMDKDLIIFLSSNALVKAYYRQLLKIADKYKSNERKLIRDFVGQEINLLNFEMLYRLKSFFDVNDNELFNFLIEGGYLYNGDRLREISLLSLDDFVVYFENSKYNDIFKDRDNIYQNIQNRKISTYKDEIIKYRSDILYVISAMNILYLDMQNIISILEMDDYYSYEQKKELLIGR